MKVISGGQTGVDRAALEAALELGLEHGGFCPSLRRAEDGPIPEKFQLVELSSTSYAVRTRSNVLEGDGTLILTPPQIGPGTRLTAKMAVQYGKPWLAVDPYEDHVERAVSWISKEQIKVLNVAGPRESRIPGIGGIARIFLRKVFESLGISALA